MLMYGLEILLAYLGPELHVFSPKIHDFFKLPLQPCLGFLQLWIFQTVLSNMSEFYYNF